MVGNDLDLKLKEAEAGAEKALDDVAVVERKIAEAQAVVTGAAKRREVHAFGAATGDQKASAAMAKIKKEVAEAEQDLADLLAALPEARRRSAAAGQALAVIRADIGRAEMNNLIRQRIEIGKEVDRLCAALDDALQQFISLGGNLENLFHDVMAARGVGHSTTNVTALHGTQRMIDAMPQMTRQFFPTQILLSKRRTPLSVSEAQFWNVPLDEDNTKGAAA